jgi:hypothetical protein
VPSNCSLCHDVGWVLDRRNVADAGLHLYLIPCPVPDCEASGDEIASLDVTDADFTRSSSEDDRVTLLRP